MKPISTRRARAVLGLAGPLLLLLTVFTAGAEAQDGSHDCPLPAMEIPPARGDARSVRRLRDVVPTSRQDLAAESDLAGLEFVTSTRPNPLIEEILQLPVDDNRTRLRITARNNSRHASPDGGITISFPDFTSPSDQDRIGTIDLPAGMALHTIAVGGRLYGRSGSEQNAEHLMIEAHGAWEPGQARTLEFEVLGTRSSVLVKYRSALSDANGDYYNAPSVSDSTDQQGWPASSCTIGGALPAVDHGDQGTAQVGVPARKESN